jgi:hypothetical protein
MDALAAVRFLFLGNLRNIISIFKAHIDYYKCIPALKVKRDLAKKHEKISYPSAILNKSIVFEFYIKGNKTYKSLKQ